MTSAPEPGAAGRDAVAVRCVELVELVTDYLEGTVSDEVRARIDAHLARCDGCTTYVEQMREVVATAGRLTPDAVPEEAVDRLLAVFRSARGGSDGPPA